MTKQNVRNNYYNEPIINIIILTLCVTPLLLSFLLKTDGQTVTLPVPVKVFWNPCLFKHITGYNCPTCGMTRSFIYMSDFKLNDALAMNAAGVLLYFFCILQIPYRFLLIAAKVKIPMHSIIKKAGYYLLIIIGLLSLVKFIKQFI